MNKLINLFNQFLAWFCQYMEPKRELSCPSCGEEFSPNSPFMQKPYGFMRRCANCGHTSYWNTLASHETLLCDENGNIL